MFVVLCCGVVLRWPCASFCATCLLFVCVCVALASAVVFVLDVYWYACSVLWVSRALLCSSGICVLCLCCFMLLNLLVAVLSCFRFACLFCVNVFMSLFCCFVVLVVVGFVLLLRGL